MTVHQFTYVENMIIMKTNILHDKEQKHHEIQQPNFMYQPRMLLFWAILLF